MPTVTQYDNKAINSILSLDIYTFPVGTTSAVAPIFLYIAVGPPAINT